MQLYSHINKLINQIILCLVACYRTCAYGRTVLCTFLLAVQTDCGLFISTYVEYLIDLPLFTLSRDFALRATRLVCREMNTTNGQDDIHTGS